MPHDETIVALSKRKQLLLLAGASLFVVAGVWMYRLDPAWIMAQRRFNDPLLVHGLGAVAVLFFGSAGIIGGRKLFDARPGLVLSPAGLTDHSSGGAVGFVPWSDINGLEVVQVQKQPLLLVQVADPAKFVESAGPLVRTLRKMGLQMYGTPVVISANSLQITFAELLDLCRTYHAKYGSGARTQLPVE